MAKTLIFAGFIKVSSLHNRGNAGYKAANWRYIGDTQGRGKRDRNNEHAVPIKAIYVYPLNKNFGDILKRSD